MARASTQALSEEIVAVINSYMDRVSYAEVIGALELVKHSVMQSSDAQQEEGDADAL